MNAVLATDMTQHMRLLGAFSEGHSQQPNLAVWQDSDVLLQLILHTADLCNPCRPLQFSIRWGQMICSEFLDQVIRPSVCWFPSPSALTEPLVLKPAGDASTATNTV